MSARNYDTLANLELATVQQRYRSLIFVYNLPLMGFASCDFAEKTGVTVWHWEMHVESDGEYGAKLTAVKVHKTSFYLKRGDSRFTAIDGHS